MNLILQPLRSLGLVILLMAASSVAFSATILSNGTGGGNWSSSAWVTTARTGNIFTSNASTAVTGTGTAFLTEINIGSVIKTGGGTPIGTVASITDNTHLTLTANAATTNSNIGYSFQGIGSGDAVQIQGGDIITIDIPVAACISLSGANTLANPWKLVFTPGSQLTVNGSATIGDPGHAGSIDMTNGGLLKVGSLATGVGGASLTPGTGTVEFTTGTSTIPSDFPNFNNITVSGTAILTASQGLTISGNVTTDAGTTLHAGDYTHFIAGNLTNNGIFEGGTQGGAGTIYLNGSLDQTISNSNADPTNHTVNITVDKPAGSVILNSDITAVNALNMISGNIILNTHNLILGIDGGGNVGLLTHTSGTIVGSGKFIRWFTGGIVGSKADAGLFPLGSPTLYRPLYISIPVAVAGGTVAVEYHDGAGTTDLVPAVADGGFNIPVRDNFSWQLSRPQDAPLSFDPLKYPALGTGTFNITTVATNLVNVGNVNDLRLMLANSVVGTDGAHAGTTTSPELNRQVSSATDLFNQFYIGSVDAVSSPLPITLLSFTASPVNGSVRLDWETTSEINNDHFTIQRSRNSVDWESIMLVPGAVNSSVNVKYSEYDESPYQGVSYYRLQQTDLDGKTSFSPIVSVKIGQSASINVYPNPTADHIFITTIGSGKLNVALYNNNGRRINVPVTVNGNSARLDVGTLSAGTYFVHILQGGQSESRVVLIAK